MTTIQTRVPQREHRPAINRPGLPDEQVNMGTIDRAISGISGMAMVWSALKRPSLRRLMSGALGGAALYWAASGSCPVYRALGINNARHGRARPHDFFEEGVHVEVTYTINRPADELYRFWRNFENLPRFMHHLEAVQCPSERESHWVARGPAGTTVEWDARVINEEANQLIAWRSLENASVDNAGSVRFLPAPGGRGTEVHVTIEYIPPAGKVGSAVAWLFGKEPRQQIQEDLRRFKQLMEAGEIPTVQGQPKGTCKASS